MVNFNLDPVKWNTPWGKGASKDEEIVCKISFTEFERILSSCDIQRENQIFEVHIICWEKYNCLSVFRIWIRIRIGSGSRMAKMAHKNRKKLVNFMFWSAGSGSNLLASIPRKWDSIVLKKKKYIWWTNGEKKDNRLPRSVSGPDLVGEDCIVWVLCYCSIFI